MSRHFAVALSLAVSLFANGALADSHEEKLRQFLPNVQSAIMEQDVVSTLRNYNEIHRDMTRADIDGLEAIWQAELNSANRPLITGVVRNVTALRMKKVIRDTGRVIMQINLVDATGLSIAQTAVFPRIWQGAPEKIMNIATAGPNMVSVGDIVFNGSGQPRQFEAIFPVADPETDELIGSVILVIDADALEKSFPDSSF
jgi:hypothetical protein